MNQATRTSIASIAGLLVGICGCASIISGRHAEVTFDTYPQNAHVVIHDRQGRRVSSFDTPGVVTLKRQSRFWMPARYTATVTAPGFQSAQVPIASTLNPWVFGNILLGGIPGLVVDSATGAAWKPKYAEVHQHLQPLAGLPPLPLDEGSEVSSSTSEIHRSNDDVAAQDAALYDQR